MTVAVPGLDGAVREAINEHVFANADREVGGVLVGRVGDRGGPPLVLASVQAAAAGERRASLTFTQDTWEHVHAEIERCYPEDQIVGWYHSHPGFGIFLSNHDLFIHRHFFSGISQIALVVDPLAGTEGVFGWDGGEIVCWYQRPTTRPGLGTEGGRGPGLMAARPAAQHAGLASSAAAHAAAATNWVQQSRWRLRLIVALMGLLLGFAMWEAAGRSDAAGTPAAAARGVAARG